MGGGGSGGGGGKIRALFSITKVSHVAHQKNLILPRFPDLIAAKIQNVLHFPFIPQIGNLIVALQRMNHFMLFLNPFWILSFVW